MGAGSTASAGVGQLSPAQGGLDAVADLAAGSAPLGGDVPQKRSGAAGGVQDGGGVLG
ncbi:hypothetical protein AB0F11_24095 [Streptomyces sp. NPDC032472]|uniref:hypothetical protein n=1 Tax=Streptomyces sp. NPDC032472 TaxID=3155018 RepID=UPI0034107D91